MMITEDLLIIDNLLIWKDVTQELRIYIERIFDEVNLQVYKMEWKSKYNSYVVYDTKPFCSDGFTLSYFFKINGNQEELISKLKYCQYLYNIRLEQITELNACVTLDPPDEKKEEKPAHRSKKRKRNMVANYWIAWNPVDYGNRVPSQVCTLDFFCGDNGFSDDDIEMIEALQEDEHCFVSDGSEVMVKRIDDVDVEVYDVR